MLKKAITVLTILIMLVEFLPCNYVSAKTLEAFNELKEGKVTTQSDGKDVSEGLESQSGKSVVLTILAGIFVTIPLSLQGILTLAVMPEQATKIQVFTIEDLLLNRFDLFNVNYFDINNLLGLARKDATVPSNTNKIIKQNVAEWFYAIRNFALAALFAVLIAIGILMAISSIASDRARYKRMLVDWVVSFAILMFLPYIMSVTFTVSETTVSIVRSVSEAVMGNKSDPRLEQTDGINFEKTLVFGKVDKKGNNYDGILQKIQKGLGVQALSMVIVYGVLIYYQIKFFIIYLKRFLAVGFLIVISPLITITYSIDKARDNQAQAYKTWMKEFLVNVFIQPLHAFIFVIFMSSIYGVMERAPLLAIIFLAALSRGEQIVRSIFKIERTSSMGLLGRRRK